MAYKLTVNGKVMTADVEPDTPLLWTLRDSLGITGPKYGCGIAACGACSVYIDGQLTRSCVLPVSAVAASAKITTIEGIGADPLGRKVQAAWMELDVAQCGYCQPGQIMAATALLKKTPKPTDAEIDGHMTNICRCATYTRIRQAIKLASGQQVSGQQAKA